MSLLLDSSGLVEPLGEAARRRAPRVRHVRRDDPARATESLDGRPDQRGFGVIDLAVRRNGYGRQLESFECELRVAGLGGGAFPAVFIRAPVVRDAGPGVEVLATLAAQDRLVGADAGRQSDTGAVPAGPGAGLRLPPRADRRPSAARGCSWR